MAEYRLSFWKTTAAALAAAVVSGGALLVTAAAAVRGAETWIGMVRLTVWVATPAIILATAWLGLVAAGGLIALRRDALEALGRPYAQSRRRESVPSSWFARCLASLARLLPHDEQLRGHLGLRPGDWIEIRSLEEILATLDRSGALDGVPFMPEMAAYCGTRTRVFRRIDKLNDWIHGTGLKRMRSLVLLESLRCSGAGHGGCQAECHLRWREAWLRRVPEGTSSPAPDRDSPDTANLRAHTTRPSAQAGETRYICQATELTSGAEHLGWTDPRHYLRDLLTGNVRLAPFLVGVALACFNWVQRHRGGVGFPVYAVGSSKISPHEALDLRPGEIVRVKPKQLIEKTLNNRSRNRGLWFDKEMLRHCGGEYRVRTRVERVIVEKTGELRLLSNPCVTLEGVTATGEYAGFNPENEYIFWREIWLERTPAREERASLKADRAVEA